MKVLPETILPSQNFLKPDTVNFIFECLRGNKIEDLPPVPIVRRDNKGNLIAIDGHNLIAVKLYRREEVEVHLASNATDGLPPISDANIQRNKDLFEKFETVLQDYAKLQTEGINNFEDLTSRYNELFQGK